MQALQICGDLIEKCPKISSYALSIVLESLRSVLYSGHPSLEDTLSIMETYLFPNITHIMYNKPLTRGHLSIMNNLLVPMVSSLERFHCTQNTLYTVSLSVQGAYNLKNIAGYVVKQIIICLFVLS